MGEGRSGMLRYRDLCAKISKDHQKQAKEGIPEQELSALKLMGSRLGELKA